MKNQVIEGDLAMIAAQMGADREARYAAARGEDPSAAAEAYGRRVLELAGRKVTFIAWNGRELLVVEVDR